MKLLYALALLSLNVQAGSELVLQLDSSLRYESNPFFLSKNVDAGNVEEIGVRGDDRVLANDVRFLATHALDSPETRLVFEGQLGQRDYARLERLNHQPHAYRAGLEWRQGPLWSGAVFHSQDKKMFDYQDGFLTTRELVHRTQDQLTVSLNVTPDFAIPVTVTEKRVTYDTVNNAFNESKDHSVDAGVTWRSGTTSKLGSGLRLNNVRFTNRTSEQIANLDEQYRDQELYLDADWQYSVKTRLGGRVAALRREYASLSNLNFSATTASLAIDHAYSPKTNVGFEAWSRPSGSVNVAARYSTVRGAQLALRWQATAKTRLSMQVAVESERFQTLRTARPLPSPVEDRIRVGASVVVALSRDLSFYVDGFAQELSRGDLGAGSAQQTLSAGLEYTFESVTGLAERSGLGARR